jgi:negative regulator of sigma E activity
MQEFHKQFFLKTDSLIKSTPSAKIRPAKAFSILYDMQGMMATRAAGSEKKVISDR